MTIVHHPTDATLAGFVSGSLDECRGLAVATHLSQCARCRSAVRAFECIGGLLLETAEPASMSASALERAMAQLDGAETVAAVAREATGGIERALPEPLSRYRIGPWRWLGRGVHWRSVDVASSEGVRVFMLKAEPGKRLPRHKHTGTEWTCVFEGAFRHDLGRFGPGDFDEADETVEHNPVVEEGIPCICLVALQGNIELQSVLGRLIQPFVRI